MKYSPTIGLEIHIELNTQSKMFCSCKNDSDEKTANTNVCPVCFGYPGTLPVANKEAIKKVIKTAMALNCEISADSFFERKNYFYPDLPKGYQISQYQAPLSKTGYLNLPNLKKKIRIERIHLEEDTGRLAHPEGKNHSLVDFNRAGVPLMELVTEPDIGSAQESREFVKELRLILRYLNVSNANMEKAQMRVEVNISLRDLKSNPEGVPRYCSGPYGARIENIKSELGTKVEIKNLNSVRSIEKAIEFEIKRQSELLDRGEQILQETRGWHDAKEITFSQRSKEKAHDYRYFPEPDLPPLKIDEGFLGMIKAEIIELPSQRRERFGKEYGLSAVEIELYANQKDLGDYFEKVISELQEWIASEQQAIAGEQETRALIKLASNYISTDLQAILKESAIDFSEKNFKITAENFAEFLKMIFLGEISSKIAKMLLGEMFVKGGDPSQIIRENSWEQVNDEAEIEVAVEDVIKENSKAAEDYKKGKQTSLQFLVGQVMTKTKGKAIPELVKKVLEKLLK